MRTIDRIQISIKAAPHAMKTIYKAVNLLTLGDTTLGRQLFLSYMLTAFLERMRHKTIPFHCSFSPPVFLFSWNFNN